MHTNGQPPDPRVFEPGSFGYVQSRERTYSDFLDDKRQLGADEGFKPLWLPDWLYDFQATLTEWAIRKGRAAIFADCGMGKTPMQLVWAENVVRHTNRPVLIITPLAVSHQTLHEAGKFDIGAERSRDGSYQNKGIVITNYERLHYFDPADFTGVVCDESSAIKNFDGKRQTVVTEFMRKTPYRLLCTATAAPNDYIELGTSSEALGYLGRMDMLGRFFKNDENSLHPIWHGSRWRFKKHAVEPFWRWVCSWARACRRPSDLGFDDDGFILPPLNTEEHILPVTRPLDGQLFPVPASNLQEQRQERRATLPERCEHAVRLVDHDRPAVVWCHLNDEADLIEDRVYDGWQVAGRHSDEEKEERFLAFAEGEIRVLITKPTIGAFGLNWQHCAHMTMFPSHSFEQYYQGVRRCWRFGQTRPVKVDIITTEGETGVLMNLMRKAEAADEMFTALVREMRNELRLQRKDNHTETMEVPQWLS